MKILSFQQEIIDKHEFLGTISNGNETIDNLHIILQYPLATQGKIIGKIIGTRETFNKVYKLFEQSSGIFPFQLNCTYQIKDESQLYLSISSQNVRIQPIGKSPEPANLPSLQSAMILEFDQFQNASTMTYEVAEIECEDLTVFTTHACIEALSTRYLYFFLAGAPKIWLKSPESVEFSSFTGNVKHTFREFNIDLGHIFPYNIKILPRFFRQKQDGATVITSVPVVQITTEESEQDLTDEQFVKNGVIIVNNIELLLSLIYKRWTTWHQYELQTNKSEIIYKRIARECLTELDQLGALVPENRIEQFLQIGYTNLEELRGKGTDISAPIAFFIAGHEARHIEEQFAITFLSLEKLKDLFAAQKGEQLNLVKEDFNKFRKKSKLSTLIEEIVLEILQQKGEQQENIDNTIQNMKDKIPDLNHPPIRSVLEKLLAEYSLDWRELYPLSQQTKLGLINTRDRMFHTSEERDSMFLLEETERLQSLVGRLLLCMLGWTDVSCCPQQDLLNILTNERTEKR